MFLANFFESMITPDTLLNNVIKDYIALVKGVENAVYLFNEESGDSDMLDDELYYDYDYEDNDIDCSNSSLKLSDEQLNIINKLFPPFEIHRYKTRTYKYVNSMRKPGCVDTYLFATLLKSLLIQKENLTSKNTIYGKEETKEFLNALIYACQFIVKYKK